MPSCALRARPLRGLRPRSGKKLVEKNSSLLFQKIFQLLKIKLIFFINFIKKMKKSLGKLDVEILSKNSGFPKKWKNKEFSLFSPGLGRRCAFGKRCVFTWMCSFCCLKKIPSLLLSSVFSFPFFSFLFFLYVFLFFFCSFSLFENDFLNSFNFENLNNKKSWEIKISSWKSTVPGYEATIHKKKQR